jgi:hypothetical protein
MLQGRLEDADRVNDDIAHLVRPGSPVHDYFQACQAFTDFFRGWQASAVEGLERTLALEKEFQRPRILSVPNDPVPVGMAHLGLIHGMQGQTARARRELDQAAAVAAALPFPHGPFSVCYVQGMRVALEFFAGDFDAAEEHVRFHNEVAERHGFTFWSMVGGVQTATIELMAGDESASDRVQGILALLQTIGLVVWQPSWYTGLAWAHILAGRFEQALPMLDRAQAIADDTGAHFWSAETARLRVQALVGLGPAGPSAVEALVGAADLARRQGATLYELRARVDLVALTGDRADRDALAELLTRAEVDDDLPELLEANRLLDLRPA